MRRMLVLVVLVGLALPAAAGATTSKSVAWQLTNAMHKRAKLLGENWKIYGAKCQVQQPGKSWACVFRLHELPGHRVLFPNVTLKDGYFSFGTPQIV